MELTISFTDVFMFAFRSMVFLFSLMLIFGAIFYSDSEFSKCELRIRQLVFAVLTLGLFLLCSGIVVVHLVK